MKGSVKGKPGAYYYVLDAPRDENNRRKQELRRGFRTKKEAEAALAERVTAYAKGLAIQPSRQLVKDYLDTWLKGHADDVKAGTWDSYRVIVANHAVPHLGGIQLQALTPTRLNQWYADLLATGLSIKTVRNIHVVIRKALGDAVDEGLLVRNPAALSKPPKLRSVVPEEMKFWTADEAADFLDSTQGDRLCTLWTVLLASGMRRGEALGLRWSDVDWDTATVTVRRAVVSVNYRPTLSTPKNRKTRRLDLDDDTMAALRSWKALRAADQLAHGPAWKGDDPQFGDLVFGQEDGSLYAPDRVTQLWDLAVKRWGGPRIRLHDARHTHATVLIKAGVPIKVVSERLGHATVAFTLQTYVHVMPGQQREAAQMMGALLRRRGA